MVIRTPFQKWLSNMEHTFSMFMNLRIYEGHILLRSTDHFLQFGVKALEDYVVPGDDKDTSDDDRKLTVFQPFTSGHYFLYDININDNGSISEITIGNDYMKDFDSEELTKFEAMPAKSGFLDCYHPRIGERRKKELNKWAHFISDKNNLRIRILELNSMM